MKARLFCLVGLICTQYSLAAVEQPGSMLRDIHLGEVNFNISQAKYFEAISQMEIEYGRDYWENTYIHDPLNSLANITGFKVADVELSYRMPQRAEHFTQAAFNSSIDKSAQSVMAYRLARYYLQKTDPQAALNYIEKTSGGLPEEIRDDEQLLRAQIYMANRRFDDAIKLLKELQKVKSIEGFAAYNLGIAFIQSEHEAAGLEQLDKAGQMTSDDEAVLAIKDKANLILGYRQLERGQAQAAKQYFDRVRLEGPFSNKALLGSGWVDATLDNYERALVPWTLLMQRNPTDKTVQESMLAVPYAYGKLGLYGKAAQLYNSTLEGFDLELTKLDKSIKSVREGKFLQAVAREEYKQDQNWMVKLRELPESPETFYMFELMVSSEFQEALDNYLDLDDLRKRLAAWDEDIRTYKELINLRRKYYKPLLPDIDKKIQDLEPANALRKEKRHKVDEILKSMQVTPRPDFLATPEERSQKRAMLEDMQMLDESHKGDTREAIKQIRIRGKRLIGLLQWQLYAAYDQRLANLHEQLLQLDIEEENLEKLYENFFVLRKVAAAGYEGYEDQLSQLVKRIHDCQEKLKPLLARQGHLLEEMIINELGQRRKLLEEYQVQGIFALAEIYDRANKKQSGGNIPK